METTPERKKGRPPTGKKTIQYSLTLAPDIAPLAELAKNDGGLSAVVSDCLKQRYQRSDTSKGDTTAE